MKAPLRNIWWRGGVREGTASFSRAGAVGQIGPSRPRFSEAASGFTLIELMVVVAIMGLILVAGVPTLYHLFRKEGMRKATSDVVEVCSKARAQAILLGTPTDVVFHPLDRRVDFGSGGGAPEQPNVTAGTGNSATIPEDIAIEMLDINLSEYRESQWARVRFYPNGTSDELTLVLRSNQNEWKKITLEVTTGLASVDKVR